ncbi:hypothetical protein [Ruegeria sp. HKCCD8929]|uniref:hypothetical protein n=1 Tax=Ruegeria sp. HKCCD8929 TaxID=2683006 RepID=UPI0020C27CD8|nr:hypothetical protein [Ruegeria sp. HKCCD8929]
MTIVPFPTTPPRRATRSRGKAMDVILHIGAHRCATTSFQHYMRRNAEVLLRQGIGFWGPHRTRSGMFHGIAPGRISASKRRRRGAGRLAEALSSSTRRGVKRLVVSDENMLGTMRRNMAEAQLYPAAGERMAHFVQAFEGSVTDVILNIRALDHYWASSLGYGLKRGRGIPSPVALEWIASGERSWRDVITDIASAIPGTRLWVLPFEIFAGRPDAQLAAVTGGPAPGEHCRQWCNATPRLPELRAAMPPDLAAALPRGDARWNPFFPAQAAHMRAVYADDLMWLATGADGLARLVGDPDKKPAGQTLPRPELTRGRRNDQNRRLARAG